MDRLPHFIQAADQPVFIGQGTGVLTCRCGESVLVRGYDPRNFLAVDFQCARCGQVTTTPGLSALSLPPANLVGLERIGQTATEASAIAPGTVLAGRDEIDRLMALFRPRTPASERITITASLLETMAEDYDRLTAGHLDAHMAEVAAAGAALFSGLSERPLVWAIRLLRAHAGDADFACARTPESALATTLVAAFQHFNECWSHHPLFPMMAATVGDTRFSLHGMALFATAKALSDSGNRVGFPPPRDGSRRIREFTIGLSPTEQLACVVDVFDRFEFPFGKPWDFAALRNAVMDRLIASRARINMKHPGMLILSPGATMESFDQPLVDAIILALQSRGRRYRDLSAISVILPKIKLTEQPDTVRFGYGFYPMTNPHHSGDVQISSHADFANAAAGS